jgi:DNA invertase Pin-like site-specific DNA recombinase
MGIIGYARVSTADQDTALQLDALREAGCERIFEEHASGADTERPVLAECLAFVRSGDVLIVWRLDRLGRSLGHLIEVVDGLRVRGVGFKSLCDPFDTTSPAGRLIFQIFGAVAEFERSIIRERVVAGIAAAKARGRVGGRRPKIAATDRAAVREFAAVHGSGAACAHFGLSRPTLARYLAE